MQDIVSTLVVAHAQGHTVGYEIRKVTVKDSGDGLIDRRTSRGFRAGRYNTSAQQYFYTNSLLVSVYLLLKLVGGHSRI